MTKRVAKEKVEYVTEQVVRPVTVQKEVYKDEVVIEETPIQTTRMERVVQKVSVPQKVMKTVPVTEIRLVPRIVTRRIPIDSNGNPIAVEPTLEANTASAPAASDSSAANEGTTVTSKKPAITESGDLPAPTAQVAPPVPVEPSAAAGTSSNTELKIGEAQPPVSSEPSTEKSGKIRVTGDE
jgi:hypothetical protein